MGISVEHRELRERTSEGFLLAGRQQLYLVYDDQPGIMAFVLLGVIIEAGMLLWTAVSTIRRPKYRTEENLSDRLCLSTVMIVTFIGMFLFVMLFEARARYLYNTIPVFSVMAVFGYYELYRKLFIFVTKGGNNFVSGRNCTL